MAKRSSYGRAQEEAAWRHAEVDAIYRLSEAGVRVPHPYEFVDGVLVMELVADPWGNPAPRLVDVDLGRREALDLFHLLVREVVKMLCAGLIHGDLSDFNVLLGRDGPVVIDFPQAIDAAANNNARKLLVRDVRNLQRFLGRFAPELRRKKYGEEIWSLYERGELMPDSELTGKWKPSGEIDTAGVLREIAAAEVDQKRREEALGTLRRLKAEREKEQPAANDEKRKRRPRKRKRGKGAEKAAEAASQPRKNGGRGPKKPRRDEGPKGEKKARRERGGDSQKKRPASGSKKRTSKNPRAASPKMPTVVSKRSPRTEAPSWDAILQVEDD